MKFVSVTRIFILFLLNVVKSEDGGGQTCLEDVDDFEVDDDVEACANDGSDYSYEESIQSNNNRRVIKTTHCPNHKYLALNPNFPVKNERTYRIPQYPMYSSEVQVSLTAEGGPIGVLFDGAMLYSAYGGSSYPELDSSYANDYDNSAPAVEGWSFDFCGQHASSSTQASWHSHVPPSCLLDQLGQTEDDHSPQIGWAVDGFPVYGPRGPSGTLMKSCAEDSADPDYCTDTCGGYYDNSLGDGFVYRYYVLGHYNRVEGKCNFDFWADLDQANPDCNYETSKEFYPFTPLCLHGCCPSDVSCSYSNLPTCGDDDSTLEDGTTDDYDDTFENSQLDYYDGVDDCTCDNSYHTTCTNYQRGETCDDDEDCAYDLVCNNGLCEESQPTASPSPRPTRAPTPKPSANPTEKPTAQVQTTTAPSKTPVSCPTTSPSFSQLPTLPPTETLMTLRGEIRLRGITRRTAIVNEAVIENAIGQALDVPPDHVTIVSMTEEDNSQRRQLLEDEQSSVLVVFTVSVPTSETDTTIEKMDNLGDGSLEDELQTAASDLGASDDFSNVTVSDATYIDTEDSSYNSGNKKKKKFDGGTKGVYTAILILLIIAIISQITACCAYWFFFQGRQKKDQRKDDTPKPVIYTELTPRKSNKNIHRR